MLIDDYLKPAPDVITQRVKDQTVLFDIVSGNYFALNELGARAWGLMDGKSSVPQIAVILATEYDAPLEVITEDLRTLIEELRADGLMTVSES